MDSRLDNAPMAWIEIDADGHILCANRRAAVYGLVPDAYFTGSIHPDYVEQVASALHLEVPVIECILRHEGGESRVNLIPEQGEDRGGIWIEDVAEVFALRSQLANAATPSRKQARGLRHHLSTALGYAELLEVMLVDADSEVDAHAFARYHNLLLAQLKQAARDVNGEPSASHSEGRHVLIVNDEEVVASLLAELMRTRRCRVTTFTDPGHALESIRVDRQLYDVAVIDHDIPAFDGIRLSKEIRDLAPGMPIVLCTNRDPRRLPMEPAVSRVLTKPVDLNELWQVVGDVLASGEAR